MMLSQGDLRDEQKCENQAPYEHQAPYEQPYVITDLIAELAIVLNDKARLQNENAELKTECQKLKQKVTNFIRHTKEEKIRILRNIKQSQANFEEKEVSLTKIAVERLEEHKKCLMEFNNLKAAYSKQKEMTNKREAELANKVAYLKMKMQDALNGYNNVKETAASFQTKYVTYKAKVKYAIGVIRHVTAELRKCQQKPSMIDVECQTETRKQKSSCSLQKSHGVENDNAILTELFFKKYPSSNDVGTIFFTAATKSEEKFLDDNV